MRYVVKAKHVLALLTAITFAIAGFMLPTQRSLAAAKHLQVQTHDLTAIPVDASVIDGAVHPELVTDNAAYRLFFLYVAPASTDSDIEKTIQHLVLSQQAELKDIEEQFANQVLSDFRTQYDALVVTYNDAAIKALNTSTRNDTTALKKFLDSRDQLVDQTRARLSSGVSQNALLKLHEHVQREKSRMRVAVEE
ncbi:MAG: hypothetical protein DMG37_04630 [Acidobacteria bacterium]|nr:MAG: hypothetical protein DMG37_04630 [Acidobacteriota bacterium]